MKKKKNVGLFDWIAPIYGLFYARQRKRFEEVLQRVSKDLDLAVFTTILDVGCGTGALATVLQKKGLVVTGIDPAVKMLGIAQKKNQSENITFLQGDVLQGLPFDDKSFDLAIASYVAHGLEREERNLMYAEMSRLATQWVIIYDYNQKRSLLTSLIEYLEGGDYFHFIKHAEKEMQDCVSELHTCFSAVDVINVDVRAAWYLCKPQTKD